MKLQYKRLTVWSTMMLLLLMMIAAGCGSSADTSSTDPAAPTAASGNSTTDVEVIDSGQSEAGSQENHELIRLTISAAASLTNALNEIKTTYEYTHPNVSLEYNFGASGTLQKQISQGAPADLFLSASSKNMQALVDEGLVDTNQQVKLLSGELVVIVPAEGGMQLNGLNDLQNDEVKTVAIGIPESVPAGSYAQEALTAAGVWDGLQSKTVQAKDVRQVLSYIETGNANAGFVYRTDALTSDKVKIAFGVDPSLYKPIVYPIGIVKATKYPEAAAEFYQFLQSDAVLQVFRKYGFGSAAA